MLKSTTTSIRNVISSPAKFTNKGARPRSASGARSLPDSRLGLGKLCHTQTTCRYSDNALDAEPPPPVRATRVESSGSATRLGRLAHLVESAAFHVVDIPIDRDIARNERMLADAPDVLQHALLLLGDGVPFDEMASRAAAAVLGIRPFRSVEPRRREIVLKQVAENNSMPQLV